MLQAGSHGLVSQGLTTPRDSSVETYETADDVLYEGKWWWIDSRLSRRSIKFCCMEIVRTNCRTRQAAARDIRTKCKSPQEHKRILGSRLAWSEKIRLTTLFGAETRIHPSPVRSNALRSARAEPQHWPTPRPSTPQTADRQLQIDPESQMADDARARPSPTPPKKDSVRAWISARPPTCWPWRPASTKLHD